MMSVSGNRDQAAKVSLAVCMWCGGRTSQNGVGPKYPGYWSGDIIWGSNSQTLLEQQHKQITHLLWGHKVHGIAGHMEIKTKALGDTMSFTNPDVSPYYSSHTLYYPYVWAFGAIAVSREGRHCTGRSVQQVSDQRPLWQTRTVMRARQTHCM